MNDPIYVLYGGTSADGRGDPVYMTYTTDYDVAHAHYWRVRNDPYSTGGVDIMTKRSCVGAGDGYFPKTPR